MYVLYMCVYAIMLIFVCILCYYVYSIKSSWELCLLLYKNRIQIKFSHLILSWNRGLFKFHRPPTPVRQVHADTYHIFRFLNNCLSLTSNRRYLLVWFCCNNVNNIFWQSEELTYHMIMFIADYAITATKS